MLPVYWSSWEHARKKWFLIGIYIYKKYSILIGEDSVVCPLVQLGMSQNKIVSDWCIMKNTQF
jgi:hypothetical protein